MGPSALARAALVGQAGVVLGALVNLHHPDHYFRWGFILISMANLIVIAVMLALFAAALALPFIRPRDVPRPASESHDEPPPSDGTEPSTWTGGLRRLGLRYLPPAKLLPDAQPAYVASWAYVFGVLTLSALGVVIGSGLVLAIKGPYWWHTSDIGLFVNSLHLWSVELFMGFMAIHLWAKFWMAAWRGNRQLTWMTGVLCFLVAVLEAFTGYLSQTNFDSQWIAFESKDAFNAGGIGALINPMNFGQALMLHIVLVPLILVALVGIHVLLVRARGVVPPIDADPRHLGVSDAGRPVEAPDERARSAGGRLDAQPDRQPEAEPRPQGAPTPVGTALGGGGATSPGVPPSRLMTSSRSPWRAGTDPSPPEPGRWADPEPVGVASGLPPALDRPALVVSMRRGEAGLDSGGSSVDDGGEPR